MKNQIDATERDILHSLLHDARKSYLQIAKDLNVSNSLVHQRVQRLKNSGIVKGTRLEIDPKSLGYDTCVFIGIVLKEARYSKNVANSLKEIPEVVECNHVTGEYALFIKLYAENNDHVRKILYENIHTIEGVQSTRTTISFETEFLREVPV